MKLLWMHAFPKYFLFSSPTRSHPINAVLFLHFLVFVLHHLRCINTGVCEQDRMSVYKNKSVFFFLKQLHPLRKGCHLQTHLFYPSCPSLPVLFLPLVHTFLSHCFSWPLSSLLLFHSPVNLLSQFYVFAPCFTISSCVFHHVFHSVPCIILKLSSSR